MGLLSRFRQGELRLGRIEAFSDGVFAIVVTLLVLELKVPALRDAGSAGELGHQLRELFPKLLSWLISFVIVCKFWLNHHHVLGLARHADYAMVWLNSIFLMCQSFVPFPTAMMGEYPTNPLAVSVFGLVMALNTLLFVALQLYIVRHLLRPELGGLRAAPIGRKSMVGVVSYLLGVAAAWVSVHLAFAIYMLTPIFFIVPREWRTVGSIDERGRHVGPDAAARPR